MGKTIPVGVAIGSQSHNTDEALEREGEGEGLVDPPQDLWRVGGWGGEVMCEA
jgi:hypothetical protein